MKTEYIISSYHQGDEEKLVKLLENVFNGWPKFDLSSSSLEHWNWKYRDVSNKSNFISVARTDDHIVGCWHTLVSKLQIGDKIVPCGQWMDAAIHPDFRGKGISSKLRNTTNDSTRKAGFNFNFGISGNPRVYESAKKVGYMIFPHNITELIKIQNIDLHLQRTKSTKPLIKKIGFYLLKSYNKIKNVISLTYTRAKFKKRDFSILTIKTFDERINIFWEEIKKHYTFIFERDKTYLNWRYCDPRGGSYIVKIAEEKNSILGYIILRINKYSRNYHTGYIVDLLTFPDRLDVADALISEAIDVLSENVIRGIVIKNHPYERLFERYGFMKFNFKSIFYYKTFEIVNEIIDMASPNNIHFQYGDFDWI